MGHTPPPPEPPTAEFLNRNRATLRILPWVMNTKPHPHSDDHMSFTWWGDLQVGGLLDVGSSWSGVEGRDQSRKLSF